MRNSRALCLIAIVVGGLTLMSIAQKKPIQQPQLKGQPNLPEQNKVQVRRVYEEMFNQGRYEGLNQVFDKNCRVHFGNRTMSLSQAIAEGKGWRSASRDMAMQVEQLTVNGDKVTAVWSARGTHNGQGLGMKPTGKQVSMHDRSVFLVKNGKIVEHWDGATR